MKPSNTYHAILPDPTKFESLLTVAMEHLSSSSEQDALKNLEYIRKCLESPEKEKKLGHHVTCFFDISKNDGIVAENDTVELKLTQITWNSTNVVFAVEVLKNSVSINDKLGNGDLTHMTYACNKEAGGKAVDSGKFKTHSNQKLLDEPLIITGTVHELYVQNSNKVCGGEPPKQEQTKAKKQHSPKQLKQGKSPQKMYKELMSERNIAMTQLMMKTFMESIGNKNPSEAEIISYIENLYL